jgi:AraC family transcriptional regulator
MSQRLSGGRFYGRLVQRRSAGDLLLCETRYAPGTELPRHSHEHAYCCLVRRGSYTETYGSRSRDCVPSTVAFHPPGEVHSQRFAGAEVWSFNVEFPAGWRERAGSACAVLNEPADSRDPALAGLALRLFGEFRNWDAFSPLAAEGLVLEVLAVASRLAARAPSAPLPRWLARLEEVLRARFAESLTLTELADLAGVHPVHLAATFRRHRGCTVGDYLRRLRVDHACRRLAGSADPLAEVALDAGFADQSHFTRTFKRLTGLTPAAYRRLARTP